MEFLVLMALLYFLPTVIAVVFRQGPDTTGIFLVNFFLGWTIVGWWVALIWALASNGTSHEVRHEVRYVPTSSGRFCSQCGTLSPSGAHFCTACGHAV
ncbi:MAG TPA: superinfection immunity protein [Candidatus Acidoferrum sp.]|nr:superinfection immunity protein [Candidatus Acidoferrum sp.]